VNINQFERLIKHLYCVAIGTWEDQSHCAPIPEIVSERKAQEEALARGEKKYDRMSRYMTLLVWGEAGIGKSETVKAVSKQLGIGFRDLRLSQLEATDLIGMPRKEEVYPCVYDWQIPGASPELLAKRFSRSQLRRYIEMNHPDKAGPDPISTLEAALHLVREGTRYWGLRDFRTVYATPDWFPEVGTHGILLLDEIGRSQDDVRQAVFQLILDRQMHNLYLPEGWIIVAATNPSDDLSTSGSTYTVDPLDDKAFLDRFLHVALKPTPEEWLEYARGPGSVDISIISVIASDPALLGITGVKIPNVMPTPRSWTMLSRILPGLDPDLGHFVALGLLGAKAAIVWESLRYSKEKPVSGQEVIDNYDEARPRLLAFMTHRNKEGHLEPRSDLLRMTFESLSPLLKTSGRLSTSQNANLVSFLRDGLQSHSQGGLGLADITSNYLQYWATKGYVGAFAALHVPDILERLIEKLEQAGEHEFADQLKGGRGAGRRRRRRGGSTKLIEEAPGYGRLFRMPRAPLQDVSEQQPWFMRKRQLL
jgi:hypothetical protein